MRPRLGTENRVKVTRVLRIVGPQTSGDILQGIGGIAKGSGAGPAPLSPERPHVAIRSPMSGASLATQVAECRRGTLLQFPRISRSSGAVPMPQPASPSFIIAVVIATFRCDAPAPLGAFADERRIVGGESERFRILGFGVRASAVDRPRFRSSGIH